MAVNFESCDSLPPDEEPKLKYQRMENDVLNILLKDAVSCICVHTKFICLGTQWGVIHLLDHEGNTVPISQDGKDRELQAHAIAVNKISVDVSGEYLASCSDDGKVLVYGLYTTDNTHNLNLGRVVKSVTIDPYYFKSGSGRRFLTGDNKLTLYEKSFLNRVRSTVLCECEGYVQAMAWHDRFVAWASEVGVRVYDLTARCSLGLIQWERSADRDRSIEDYRCNLVWAAPKTLMIGWVDTIRICVIRKRSQVELQTRDVTEYLVDPVYTFQIEYYISGLGPLDDQLVVLGVPKERDAPDATAAVAGSPRAAAQRPVLMVADYKDCEFCELSADSLNIRCYEEYSCNDYFLDMLIEENRFFIVSPKDIVVASPYDIDDKVNWLTKHGRFEKAITVLEEVGGKSAHHSVVSVGEQFLDHLMAEHHYEEAAVLCARMCKNDKSLWENHIIKFASVNQLRAVSAYVPKTAERALSPHLYELILYEYLKVDPQGFLTIVKEWNPALYKTGVIVKEVLEHLLTTEIDKNIYLEALALLYCYQKKYDKALTAYLKLQHKDVFNLITEHKMYNGIHDKILDLMTLDCDKTISVLLDKTKVPVEVVEKQLAKNEMFLFKYLDAYSKVEPNGRYHGRLVRLYARHARDKLLPFLRCSDNYPIQEALDVCHSHQFYPEMVFLLGRIGNTRDSLQIIIEQLNDINQAISFCQEHNDKELWTDLIKQTIDKPEYVTLLLKRIGNYVDPRMLIENIQAGCEIADLKEALAKMMCDYHLQLSVQEACKVITLRNYFDLHEKLIVGQQRGISVTDDFLCCICKGKIIIKDLSNASDLMVYSCRHSFHIDCLPTGGECQNCTVCSAVKM